MTRRTLDPIGGLRLSLGLTAAILLPEWVGAGRVGLAGLAALFLVSAVSVFLGRTLAQIFGIPRLPGFIAAFEIVAGFAAFSLLQLGATECLDLDAVQSLAASAAAVGLLFVLRRRLSDAARRELPGTASRAGWLDVGILLAISLLATLWSREALASLRGAEMSGDFAAWNDFFPHASQIEYLRDYPAFARQALDLSDVPQNFYHRASYAIPALFSRLARLTTLQAALYFWLPAGLVLLGIGVYGLASALAGRMAGVVACLALYLLPDASMYGLHNGFFSFYWLIEIAPASAYGIAVVLIALAVFVTGISARRFGLVLLSASMAALSVFFKAHMAVLALPLFSLLTLAGWRPPRAWQRVAAIAALGLAAAAAVMLLEHIRLAPHLLSGRHELLRSFSFALAQGPQASSGLYAQWTANSGAAVNIAIGTVMWLASAFGLLLPAAIAAALLPFRPRLAWQIETVPFALLGLYLAVLFFLPTPPDGDFTEFAHRSFPLVYAVLVATLAAGAVAVLKNAPRPNRWLRRGGLLLGCILAAFALAGDWAASAHIQQSTTSWGPTLGHTPIPPALFQATRYIRENARPGDRVLASDGDPSGLIVALSERQAFLARADVFLMARGPMAAAAAARRSLVAQLQARHDYDALRAFGQRYRIRWFLLQPGDGPPWPPAVLRRSPWAGGGFRVFDLTENQR